MSDEVFLVPRAPVEPRQVEVALSGLDVTAEEPEDGFLASWRLPGALVRIFDDPALHVVQLMVTGPDRDDVAARLRAVIPTFAPEDMPGLFAAVESRDHLVRLLGLLAALSPETADPALVALYREGFGHADALVRMSAVLDASVPGWPELRPDIERLAVADEDERVRETAATVLDVLDRRRATG
ncbi:MAG TPA: hypothetical protein VKB57_26770 [Acidimicrobiales bacterium]|nr:hypothetical protein [Acidimicrobiales bacterium]